MIEASTFFPSKSSLKGPEYALQKRRVTPAEIPRAIFFTFFSTTFFSSGFFSASSFFGPSGAAAVFALLLLFLFDFFLTRVFKERDLLAGGFVFRKVLAVIPGRYPGNTPVKLSQSSVVKQPDDLLWYAYGELMVVGFSLQQDITQDFFAELPFT